MPSPIGHLLAALTAGGLTAPPVALAAPTASAGARHRFVLLALVAAAGLLPDLDLLVGSHSGPTHSLGAAALASVVAAAGPWRHRRRAALAVFAAYASHVLLDWLSEDTSAPVGIMVLWPLSHSHWHAPLSLFFATDRRYWLDGFWMRNLQAVLWELMVFVPSAAIVLRRLAGFVAGAASAPLPGRSPGAMSPRRRRASRPACRE